jgi:TPR repeat protein
MKTFTLAFLAACAPVLAQTNYGTITFTNKSGDVISNAVVTKVEAGKLTYRYSLGVGGGVVRLADLPEGLQARFGYSPDSVDNAAALQRPAEPTEADRKKFEEIKAKAAKGEAEAQYNLGWSYDIGDGVT